ncbi:helix-turn-helix transcriptional regulator [Pseudomonas aeruginosa]|nr:helix-turn-helix transcriptional regulator [Pseudomonas aeruginosa]
MARISAQLDKDRDLVKLGAAIRARRIALAYSQEALADASSIDRSHMGKIERGEHMPTLAIIFKIARALGLSVAHLMGAAEEVLGEMAN